MHLLLRETRSLDEDAQAQDLDHAPAPLVMLSFSDADLAALAAAYTHQHPPLRLASLARLRHPLSVDLYAEKTLAHAKCIVIRLLGGLDYWRYGAEETAALARRLAIPLALLPGDAQDGTRLRELSTIDPATWSTLDACFRIGGPANMARALAWAAHAAGLAPQPTTAPEQIPQHGVHTLDLLPERPLAAIVFYRSHLLSADIAPITELTTALQSRSLAVGTLYASSLKSPETATWIAATLKAWRPSIILNATAFSARPDVAPDDGDGASPLEAPGAPILQLVLSGSRQEAWSQSTRGLSPTDLAMHVVLPEQDGRLLTTAISFKADTRPHPDLGFSRTIHAPHHPGIALAADRAAAWSRLATTPRSSRRLAIILSDYPGIGGQQGHAVGLDTFASLSNILSILDEAGYDSTPIDTKTLTTALTAAAPTEFLSLEAYQRLLPTLPVSLREAVHAAWGPPTQPFTLRHLQAGNIAIALQPDRGSPDDRKSTYHAPDLPPTHAYVAFHLWLRHVQDIHALIHLGTHGSLEWLPGKATALSADCHPQALLGPLPVIYPFIVNNPGEAAPAKRRLGAVTIGHLTPPIAPNTHHGPAADLERLLDEHAAAEGLDRRRTTALRRTILQVAQSSGLLTESGTPPDATEEEALTQLDAYLCDVKDLQLRDGLHIYAATSPQDMRTPELLSETAKAGLVPAIHAAEPERSQHPQPKPSVSSVSSVVNLASGSEPSPTPPTEEATQRLLSTTNERKALLNALDARFIPPGPAGAPSRNRPDVLPTGRNLTTIDPRAIPTRSALPLAERAAAALLRRHLAEHGEYPQSIILDLWASATIRTGGEDLALAFVLLGARPVWDPQSTRVSGFEILPIALLDRPRIDVTLRISGLFRDAFPTQLALFDSLVQTLATRDEAPDWNPLAQQPGTRIYGPAPGQYGAGEATAQSWLEASSAAYGKTQDGQHDAAGLKSRLANADAFIHTQDHAEQDLLDSPEWAAHEGGFAQAAAAAGATPALYHLDTSRPESPKPRTVAEEVRRVVRARAANPAWLQGQMRHAHRGAAEIARPLAALEAFARTLPTRFDAQFDLLHEATIGNPEIDAFLRAENPEARADMAARFARAQATGLWHPRKNTPPC